MQMKIPGLIDLQVNGYKGVDFSGPALTEEDFVGACRAMLDSGTTAFLPTIITSPQDVYERNLAIMAKALRMPEFRGRLLGIHVEGPFISPQEGARGAHNADWIREPDVEYLEWLISRADGRIKLLTIAAEPDGAEQLARYAITRGVTVALGHQMAGDRDLERLSRAGAAAVTHLGNAVPAVLPRHDNPIWPALANDNLLATIITDGHHLPDSVIKTIVRAKGPDRCIVISDASPVAGLPAGRHRTLGHNVILEESGRLFDPETGYLCGSSATMLDCMNHLASLDLVTSEQLAAMGFDNPLRLTDLKPEDVAPGKDIFYDTERHLFHLTT
ncbi:MAG: amidohydrolase family protein [Phycisphaerales bacterium]|nr:MAG: amidohydrolase family protein [Phycisphaerales bacterium]